MNERLTCSRCGHEGDDVRTKIVALEDEVLVAVGDYSVRERFVAEPRCLDRGACDERYDAEGASHG